MIDGITNLPTSAPATERLRWAATEFEAFFLNQMLSSLRRTVPEGGLFSKSAAMKTFEAMLDEELARVMAQGDGIGLGKMIYEDLARHL